MQKRCVLDVYTNSKMKLEANLKSSMAARKMNCNVLPQYYFIVSAVVPGSHEQMKRLALGSKIG